MQIIEPALYGAFHCIGGACPDTCCAAWEVVVDPASAEKYRKAGGAIGERLRSVMEQDGEDMIFRLQNGRCPFLNEQNLCDLYIELGEAALCATCTKYPRFTHVYGGATERGLSLSCPEVARLLLEPTEPMAFVTRTEAGFPEPNALNPTLYLSLRKARAAVFTMLQNRSLSLEERARRLWTAGEAVQRTINRHHYAEIVPVCGRFLETGAQAISLPELPAKPLDFLTQALPRRLESLTPQDTPAVLWAAYPEAAVMLEHFLVYGVYRYWMEAAYDRQLLPKVRLCIRLYRLAVALAAQTVRQTGAISKEALRKLISLCCKEIEHSSENLEIFSAVL